MKKLAFLFLSITLSLTSMASGNNEEEPIQHHKVADITSLKEAKRVLIESTFAMLSKQKLDVSELEDLHLITYSLEKSIAYFVDNKQQPLANEIAIVVEDIHIQSENHRPKETRKLLDKYAILSQQLILAL